VAEARNLEGKAVAITGAAKGLGRAYALDAAGEGARLMLGDVDADALADTAAAARERGANAAVYVGDISQFDHAQAFVERALRHYDRLDGLVNNAGIRPEGAAWSEDPELVRSAVQVNVLGSIFCGLAALPAMKDQGSGSVINVSSRAQSGIPTSPTYAATKGALASLTYSWAIDLYPHGVRVNAVAPQAGGTGTRRAGQPDEGEPTAAAMAPLVTYLLSDRSCGITGQVIRLGRARPTSLDLALMSHPRTLRSYGRDGGWTVDALEQLFDSVLGPQLEPVGAVPLDVAYQRVEGQTLRIDSALGL
jgi:NAD(P)-dependent dehydrogenase (short-subunit alcohol dehydrogenase family)